MQHENEIFLTNAPLPEADTSISLDIVSEELAMRGGNELAQKKNLEGKITLNPQSVRISPITHNAGITDPSNPALDTRWKFYLIIMPFTLHRAPGTNRYQSVTLFINLYTPNVTAFDLFPKNITTQISTTTFYTITPDMRIREVQANSSQPGRPLIHFETLYPHITSFGEGENRFYWTYDSNEQQREVPPETKYVLALLRVAHDTEVIEGTISYEVVTAKNLLGMWRTANSEVDPYPIRWELGKSTPNSSTYRTSITSQTDPQKEFNVFYSYAPKDEVLRKELDKHLTMFKRQGLINEVYAHDIGQVGLKKVDLTARLQQSKLILLLISPDFLSSDSLYENELQPAIKLQNENKARIIPILLRPSLLEDTPLENFVVLPRNNKPISASRNRDTAFAEIAKEIREVIKQLRDPNT